MVETALVLPIFVLFLFMTIDLARAAYTWVMLGQDAEVAARQVSLPDNQASDCSAITALASSGNGITIAADPKSIINDGTPSASSSYTAPTGMNSGYLYIYPAQATANPPATNCANTTPSTSSATRQASSNVTALVTFNFVPWTPIASQLFPSITLAAQATEASQY